MSRLSMWHLGMADIMFAECSTKKIIWDPGTSMFIGSAECDADNDNDHDWTPLGDGGDSSSSDEDEDYDSEDVSWCAAACTLNTWEHTSSGHKSGSKRKKFQQRPLLLM